MPINKLIILCAGLLLAVPSAHAKMYKWVDEQGNVHYTDKVPPSASTQGHRRINERGMTVEEIAGARSQEEIAREEELQRLREEQQQLLKEQEEKDKALLETYRTEDDIALTRNGKLATIDARVAVTMTRIEGLKERLSLLQADAAALELEGKKPTPDQLKRIDDIRNQIETTYASLVYQEQEKKTVNAEYERDVARFRILKNLKEPQQLVDTEPPKPNVLLDTVVPCPDSVSCERIWLQAREYSQLHATTRVQVDGNRILLFAPPRKDNDISLTVSRIRDYAPGQEAVFLDIQCRNTLLGQEFCKSEKIHQVRYGFREAATKGIPAKP